MHKKILLFLFFATGFHGFSQESEKLGDYFSKGSQYIGNNKDSTYYYLNKTIVLADKTDQIDYILSAYIYLIYANGLYFDLKNFKSNLDKLDVFLTCDPRFENHPYKNYFETKLIFEKGNYQYKLGNYEKAEYYFLQVYNDLKDIPKENLTQNQLGNTQSALAFLAASYRNMGKYSLAKEYYYKTLDFLKIHQNQLSTSKSKTALIYVNLAKLFQVQKEYEEADHFIKKALDFYNSDLGIAHKNSFISAHHVLTENYLLRNQPDSALAILRKIDQKKYIDPENLKFSKDQVNYKAHVFAQKKDFQKALSLYEEDISITQQYFNTKHHPEIAEIYAEIGVLYGKQGEFGKSLSAFQQSLSALSETFKSEDYAASPEPENVNSKLVLIKVLGEKQGVMIKAYAETHQINYLKIANSNGKSIVNVLEALKPEFESKVDMQFLLKETFPAFDNMVEVAFLLYQKTGEKSYLNDAFRFVEKSKAVLLLSAVQSTKITKFAGVPDSIISREHRYLANINHLEKEQYKNPNSKEVDSALFRTKTNFYTFLDGLKSRYPKYHALKFKTQVIPLDELKTMLQPEEAMLSYYATKSELYYFLIGTEKVSFKRIPLADGFSEKISALQKLLSTPSVTKIDTLKKLSNQVFQKIFPAIGSSISSLIIIRSDILNYIPFEALYNSKKKAYLIEDYIISYANSATLYQEFATLSKPKNNKLLAFAPSFRNASENNRGTKNAGLGVLLYNKKEVELISDYFEGDVLLNNEASLQAFENKAPNFGILHLATHAIINDKFPDYSFLAFASTPKDSVSNSLYVKDLYNYDLNASLVTLSACETGVGKLRKGAGMLSLARGFNYAGASSLITTQWKIDDKSTSSLMKNFYKNLSKGKAKNVALRNAKLHYLKTTDDPMLRHPYYWAGFVLTGNTSPIIKTGGLAWYWWVGGGLALLLLFSGFYVRKRLF